MTDSPRDTPEQFHKLIADVLEHDRRMTDGPWSASSGGCGVRDKTSEVARCWAYEHSEAEMLNARSNAAGIALYRTAAPQLATALRDALASDARARSLNGAWSETAQDAIRLGDEARAELAKVRGELRDSLDRERALEEAIAVHLSNSWALGGKDGLEALQASYERRLEERRRDR